MDAANATNGQLGPVHSAASTLSDRAEARRWLLCRSGLHLFALPLDHLIETMRTLPIKPIAGAPPCVRGLSIVRGAPVPVVEAGCLLGDEPDQPERFVTVATGTRTVAIAVAAVLGIYAADADQLSQLPPLLTDAGDTIAWIASRDAELLLCLQSARLVPNEVLDRLDAQGVLA